MAPEQLQERWSPAIDVYALGLISVELAAMWPVPNEGEPWQRLRNGDLSDLPWTAMAPDMADVVRAALAPDPAQRPTAEQLLRHPALAASHGARLRHEQPVRDPVRLVCVCASASD
jgi:mitosis inhibitor protein kinase SWE1